MIWLFNPSKLGVAACLVQKFTGVVVYVDPRVRLCIAFRQVAGFVERFTLFPERSAWPCERIDWIQSYNAILTLRCLLVPALFTSGWSLLYYLNVDTKASIESLVKLSGSILQKNTFLLFPSSMFPSK